MDARTARRRLDERLRPWRELASAHTRPHRGWIRAIRDALGMSSTELGRRMGVDQSRVTRIEQSELDGGLTLDTLERTAAALGCRLVYALVPDDTLEAKVQQRAREKAAEELAPVTHTMSLEDQQAGTDADEELLAEFARSWIDRRGLWS